MDRNPAANVQRPRQRQESTMSGLDRNELGIFSVQAGLSGARDQALACLLALNGLPVSEAIGTDVDDLGLERGHHTLQIVRKGGSTVILPLAESGRRSRPVGHQVRHRSLQETRPPSYRFRCGQVRVMASCQLVVEWSPVRAHDRVAGSSVAWDWLTRIASARRRESR